MEENSWSLPAVGRYRTVWREGMTEGNFKIIVRKPGEVVGKTEI